MITMERACEGKQRYYDPADAEYAASRTQELNVYQRADWHPIRAYCCPYGSHWHIGHQPGKKRGVRK